MGSVTESGAHPGDKVSYLSSSRALHVSNSPEPELQVHRSMPSFYVGTVDWTQVLGLLWQTHYPLSHHPNPYPATLMKTNFSLRKRKKAGENERNMENTLWMFSVYLTHLSAPVLFCYWKLIQWWFLKYYICLLWESVSMYGHVCAMLCVDDQRTTCWNWFYPSTVWIPGIKLKWSGLEQAPLLTEPSSTVI